MATVNLLDNRCLSMSIYWNIVFTFNLPYDMRTVILSYIEDWTTAARKIQKSCVKQIVRLQWDNPPPGIMKINVDGSRYRCGNIGAGGVLRNSASTWSGGFIVNLGTGVILQAEAWGMFYGLQMALRYGVQGVELESDFAVVVNLLLDGDAYTHPLGTVITNCKSLYAAFLSCSTRHAHREKNVVADILAKASLENAKGVTWLDDAPTTVAEALLEDMVGATRRRMIPAVVPHCSTSHST